MPELPATPRANTDADEYEAPAVLEVVAISDPLNTIGTLPSGLSGT